MSKKIVVNSPTRTRKWGWGYSCTPTGHGTEIEQPVKPDYVGTLNQVAKAQATDRTFKSLRSGGTFTSTATFYDGKVIEGFIPHEGASVQPLDYWDPEFDGKGPLTLVVEG